MIKDKRVGYTVFLINTLLILFLMTSKENIDTYYIISCISSLIAIIFNVYILIKNKIKTHNIISLVLIVLSIIILSFIYFNYLIQK